MKTQHLLHFLTVCGLAATLHAQTPPLTPSGPPSDPATAMKSLNQIEPRTIIDSLPFTITQAGSYYLTKNLEFTASSGNAITVDASNVSIDLNGFTISSAGAVTGSAIYINSDRVRVVVSNGSITGTTTVSYPGWVAVLGGFSSAVNFNGASSTGLCQFTKLHISGCRSTGLKAPNGSVLDDVTVTRNGGGGIIADGGIVRSCVAAYNGMPGGGFATAFPGISADSISDSSAYKNSGVGILGTLISDSKATDNGSSGIYVVQGTASHCVARGNQAVGIFGIDATITNSTALQNSSDGIQVGTLGSGGTISFCVANGNTGFGISAQDAVVSSCRASGNTGGNLNAVGAVVTGNSIAP